MTVVWWDNQEVTFNDLTVSWPAVFQIGHSRIGTLAIAGEYVRGLRVVKPYSSTIVADGKFAGPGVAITWSNPVFVSTTTEVYPGVAILGRIAPGFGELRQDLRKVTIEAE